MSKCKKCNEELLFNDNSIAKLKNKEGFVEIYPIGYCAKCNIYYSNELDGRGFVNKLSKTQREKLGCEKWF